MSIKDKINLKFFFVINFTMSEKKLKEFIRAYCRCLYEQAKPYREKFIPTGDKNYQEFEQETGKRPLILYDMIKDEVKDEKDIAALLVLVTPYYFTLEKDRTFLLQFFGLNEDELNERADELKKRIEERVGKDWIAKVYEK